MLNIKSFKFRIYPTSKQNTLLNQNLEACRFLYNHFLSQRKDSYEKEKKSLTYHTQAVSIVKLKKEKPFLQSVHAQVLQNVAVRIDLGFKAFFRRVKAKENPGYPRFKGYGRYNSITFPQASNGSCQINNNRLYVSKIGHIKIKQHRELPFKPKTATISKSSTGKWYVSFTCEINKEILKKTNKSIGIDVGIESFITFSDGSKIDNPKFFRKDEKDLAKAQRKLSKAIKGSPDRKRRRKAVSKIHERISNRRTNFTHQESTKIIKQFDTICIEDLSINKMLSNNHRCLNKSITDASWSQFFNQLSYKAEYAGRKLVKVNPAYTSQTCSICGHRREKKLSERVHNCPCCNISIHRDHNASLNILSLGLQTLALNELRSS